VKALKWKGEMKTTRAAPALLIGFSLLIGLIAITGIGAWRRARGTYRDVSALNDRYRATERALDTVGSGIYTIGLLARDYLLDSSASDAAEYREQLIAERAGLEKAFAELNPAIRGEDKAQLDGLRQEVDGYFQALQPLFSSADSGGAVRNWGFLRKQILRRREAAFSIARQISALAEENLQRQRREIDDRQNAMASFIQRMLALTVLLGLAIAAVTVLWMSRLAEKSREHRLRTEAAERELRKLSRQLVHAQEQERKLISRELHDEVGQMLTALRMELRNLQEVRTAPEADFNEHADSAKRLAEQSLRALKDIAMGLRPSMLDDLGLGSAVQWQVRQFSKHTGIPVNVRIASLPQKLPEQQRTCVYRLVQEALTNCARHARARNIDVAVSADAGQIRVSVRDDGVGFNAASARGRGLGLLGMQERVMELGGDLSLASTIEKGTVLTATIPFTEEAPANAGTDSAG
jgi:signal transduction histidine kinase